MNKSNLADKDEESMDNGLDTAPGTASNLGFGGATSMANGLLGVQGEEKRTSLLDMIKDNLTRTGKYQSDSELITGMLMIFAGNWVHVLEASQKVVLGYLRELGNQKVAAEKYSSDMRVLVLSDDIPQRFYPVWACRVLERLSPVPIYIDDSVLQADTVAKTNDLKAALDDMASRYKDVIPSTELVEAICNCNLIMPIENWLSTFDGHLKYVNAGDLVWPAPKMISI
ncbi:hypothetical protein HDU76_008806 [Blyttiomyces sp. JEL0837]|nr:hypothetical protein HDU76_008806 [Blyttiomyces sp. JEL0837]